MVRWMSSALLARAGVRGASSVCPSVCLSLCRCSARVRVLFVLSVVCTLAAGLILRQDPAPADRVIGRPSNGEVDVRGSLRAPRDC